MQDLRSEGVLRLEYEIYKTGLLPISALKPRQLHFNNLAEHLDHFSHDTINRYLKGEKLSPRSLFEKVEELVERDPEAYLIFLSIPS